MIYGFITWFTQITQSPIQHSFPGFASGEAIHIYSKACIKDTDIRVADTDNIVAHIQTVIE